MIQIFNEIQVFFIKIIEKQIEIHTKKYKYLQKFHLYFEPVVAANVIPQTKIIQMSSQ